MANASVRVAVVVLLSVFALSGCASKKDSFLMVNVCLKNAESVNTFKSLMQRIASQNRMEYTDTSNYTQNNLQEMANSSAEAANINPRGKVVHLSVDRKDGMGLGAGNIGLREYQVAVEFSEGDNSDEARKFAKTVVALLKAKWRVEDVPKGKGAFPMKDCGPLM